VTATRQQPQEQPLTSGHCGGISGIGKIIVQQAEVSDSKVLAAEEEPRQKRLQQQKKSQDRNDCSSNVNRN